MRTCRQDNAPGSHIKYLGLSTLLLLSIGLADVAFAEEIATAISDTLSLPAYKYDFQVDDLTTFCEKGMYDFLFVRYAIGFCENLTRFVDQGRQLLRDDGVIYIAYSPASRAVCAPVIVETSSALKRVVAPVPSAVACISLILTLIRSLVVF